MGKKGKRDTQTKHLWRKKMKKKKGKKAGQSSVKKEIGAKFLREIQLNNAVYWKC